MVGKLLKFYDENYNSTYLFYKKLLNCKSLRVKLLIIIISSIFIVFGSIYIRKPLLSLAFAIPYWIYSKIFIQEISDILSKKHNISIKNKVIDFNLLNMKLKKDVKSFLIINGIDTVEKLKYFISLLEEDTKKSRFKNTFNKSLVVGMIAPVWIQYVTRYYREVKSSYDAFIFLFLITIIAFIVLLIYELTKPLIMDIINYKYNKLKKLLRILKEIYMVKLK